MFYEDVRLEPGETVSGLVSAYGYKAAEWQKIWTDPKNAALVASRKVPEKLQIGDTMWIKIPWKMTSTVMTKQPRGGSMQAKRDGEPGRRITWVQTVYQHNQPVAATGAFCVDGCPADDNLPFYYTETEIKADRTRLNQFYDYSQRNPPTVAQGTTKWRAVLSLAVVTKLRVSVWGSIVWGWDMTPANVITTVGPRTATALEVQGHLNLLGKGSGTGPLTFGKAGWLFRQAI
jgi:hypothetical protein